MLLHPVYRLHREELRVLELQLGTFSCIGLGYRVSLDYVKYVRDSN